MRNNFIEILANKIEIPMIQRDYAQGRTDIKTNKIRKEFLDVIFDLLEKQMVNGDQEIDLDFIYGFTDESDDESEFIPIDGQQRLTTLWLLYWYISAIEGVKPEEKEFLKNFKYEIRHSTSQFCSKLVAFMPGTQECTISFIIKEQPWYIETWDYDPTIQAMLIVLDDIERRYSRLNLMDLWSRIAGKQCPFYFYKLDMKKVGLTDDLYIKMNSRGKALTEFEYFKARYSDVIADPKLRERFEVSVDGKWADTLWQIVLKAIENEEVEHEEDIAQVVDSAFLNLFNYLSSVIAFRSQSASAEHSRYIDTETTPELLPEIYSSMEHVKFLFDTIDAICNNSDNDPDFWETTFYYEKEEFGPNKVRLYFQSGEPNLLNTCLFHFSETRGFSYPEQIMLFACLEHFKAPAEDFASRIRILRNLVANSSNELRAEVIGKAFDVADAFMKTGDLSKLGVYKTDQIEEEKQKQEYLSSNSNSLNILHRLEDSDVFRGSISLIPLDSFFSQRAAKFMELFDEDEFIVEFQDKSNLFLCFGDYTQKDGHGGHYNLIAPESNLIRRFLTTPGYDKEDFYKMTQPVFIQCLDYFIANPGTTIKFKIKDTLKNYENRNKDWSYYFIKYPSFRDECRLGFYHWPNFDEDQYLLWKMGKKQFNGYHWDPFLHELFLSMDSEKLSLYSYGHKLVLTKNRKKVEISSISNGFVFENAMSSVDVNILLEKIKETRITNSSYILKVKQDENGMDVEDRIEKLKMAINQIFDLA